MTVAITPQGDIVFIYTETIELAKLGLTEIARASYVEPCGRGWTADMSPVAGPILGPFVKRSEALAAEEDWIERNIL
jgi:hypothetical protein